jgi:hypothetical protein
MFGAVVQYGARRVQGATLAMKRPLEDGEPIFWQFLQVAMKAWKTRLDKKLGL